MKEEFHDKYPRLASRSRLIHTYEDTKEQTSFETYLRGELSTYSPKTLYLYGQMLTKMIHQKRNIVLLIQEQTVQAYGYSSLEEAEEKL